MKKQQIPHGLKAVRDDNSEITKPDLTYAALIALSFNNEHDGRCNVT